MPTTRARPRSSIRLASRLPSIDPVRLTPRAEPFDDAACLFEPKYDGFRGVIYAAHQGCEIRSRRDIPLNRFRELWDRVGEVLGGRETILDGEIVSLNRQGRPVFQDLLRGAGFIAFAAFDLLWLDGVDLRNQPLSARKDLLGELLPQDTGPLYKILTIEEHGRALYSAIRKMDLEGIVAKQKSDPYGPQTCWYKIKNDGYSQWEGRADGFLRRGSRAPGPGDR
jgi:bifunctional non-homologous end joining protein LigD